MRPPSWFKGALLLRGGEGKERGRGGEGRELDGKESRNTPSINSCVCPW